MGKFLRMAPKWLVHTISRIELSIKMGKTKGRGSLVKEKIMSSVVDMLRLGCFLDFQAEILKRQLGLQVWISGHRPRLEI